MNQHDDALDPNHGWVDPAETGLLAETLGAMAGGVDAESPTGPAAALTTMSRRVRRRRTAKLGGLGGGALALVAVLALGATQLAPPDQSDALPGSSSSAPDFQVQDGYQPSWLGWSDLTCGMPVADLESTAPGWSVEPAGEIYARTADLGGRPSTSWGMASTIQQGPGGVLGSDLALVWSQDGSVVDLGPDVFGPAGEPGDVPLIGSDLEGTLEAQGAAASTCSPTGTEADPVYESPLPEGEYEVRVVAFPQIGSNEWQTAVSDPVTVRIDAAGAPTSGEAPGESTEGFPEPVEGQVSRFELERKADWVTAEMTQQGHSSDTPMRVMGLCLGPNPVVMLPIELVLPSTGAVLASTQISCDGDEAGSEVGVLAGDGEAIDIRLPSVPDGVSLIWLSLEPRTPIGGDTGPECSATGFEPQFVPGNTPTEGAAAGSGPIVIAAMDCDSTRLIALAKESGTELMSGTETPEQTFALPETDAEHYRTIAALLTDTAGAVSGGDPGNETVVWPRVATEEFADSDEAWAEVVAAGLLTAEEADAQRADGYQGMRIGIAAVDGTWQYYSAGD